jgi:hypothetical protein
VSDEEQKVQVGSRDEGEQQRSTDPRLICTLRQKSQPLTTVL